MNPKALYPLFPLDILSYIILHVVGDPSTLIHRPEELCIIKNCALVSKDLASLCQAYLFRRIDAVGFGQQNDARRLKKLLAALRGNPYLSRYVRDLTITSGTYLSGQETPFSTAEIPRMREILLGFYKIERLRLGRVRSASEFETDITTLFCNMITAYTSGEGLKLLDINNMSIDDALASRITTCPTLAELRLQIPSRLIPFPFTAVTNTQMKTLALDLGGTFNMHILSFFPYLEDLTISSSDMVTLTSYPTTHDGIPSMRLSSLSLQIMTPGSALSVVKYYQGYESPGDIQALSKLRRLDYSAPSGPDVVGLESILNVAKLLEVLKIDLLDHEVAPAATEEETLHLIQCLEHHNQTSNSFSALSELHLELAVGQFPATYDRHLEQILSFFTSLSTAPNAIQEIGLRFEIEFAGLEPPPPESLSKIGSILASESGFPKLMNVEVSIDLRGDEDWEQEMHEGGLFEEDEFGDFMSRAMKDLMTRDGVMFRGWVDVLNFP